MKNSKERISRYAALLPWTVVLLLYGIFSISGRMYADWDNYSVAIIINGLTGNNNICQYQHPLLCVLMGLVKKLLPMADCFILSIHLLLIAALAFTIMILRDHFPERRQRILIWAGLLYLSWGIGIWNVNYTVWAAFFCFSGMLGVFAAKAEERGRRIIGSLFFLLGLMLRHQSGLLFLPYIALAAACRLIGIRGEESGKKRAGLIRRLLPLIIGIVLVMGSRLLFYSTEPWKSGWEFDKARVTIADFPVTEWEELEKNAADSVDRLLYKGARHWMYADTDLMNLENLQKMAKAGRTNAFDYDLQGIGKGIEYALSMIVNHPVEIMFPILFLLLLAGMTLSVGKLPRLEVAAVFGGGLLILFYFIMRGRAPARVWQLVLLAGYSVILTIPAETEAPERKAAGRKKLRDRIGGFAAAFLLVASLICLLRNGELHAPVTPLNAAEGAEDGVFSVLYGTDTRYLACGWTESMEDKRVHTDYLHGWGMAQQQYRSQDKLPPEEFFRHYISSGWFGYGQEYYRSLLEEIGTENPVRALIGQDNVYLLDMSEDTMFREYFYVYLYEHYGDMLVKKIGELDGYPVYRFRKENEEEEQK